MKVKTELYIYIYVDRLVGDVTRCHVPKFHGVISIPLRGSREPCKNTPLTVSSAHLPYRVTSLPSSYS